ncbi:hypothetical protein PAXRUDRAFT_178172, partial [Paxillus rubicundulus Ve08.2h10]
YFKATCWEYKWIKTAEDLVCDEYACLYADNSANCEVVPVVQPGSDKEKKVFNIFNNLPALAPPRVSDIGTKVQCYPSMDVEHIVDPIA